jgi:hypothetical protein
MTAAKKKARGARKSADRDRLARELGYASADARDRSSAISGRASFGFSNRGTLTGAGALAGSTGPRHHETSGVLVGGGSTIGQKRAQKRSAEVRGERRDVVLAVKAAIEKTLAREPTQPEIVTEMRSQRLIRRGEKSRLFIYNRDGKRVGKPLPDGMYPLKNILRKKLSR